MLVSEILAIKGKVLFTIAPNKSVAEAIEIMNEQDVGSLVVFSRGEMVGMLTFRQVLQGVQKGSADLHALTVEAVMIRNPFAASPNMEMDELRRMMVEHHQRYLLVLPEPYQSLCQPPLLILLEQWVIYMNTILQRLLMHLQKL